MHPPHRLFHVIVIVALGAGGGRAAGEPAAEIAARVGSQVITREQLAAGLKRANADAVPVGPQRRQAEAVVMEQLVNDAILRQAVTRAGIVAAAPAVEAQVKRIQVDLANRGIEFAEFLTRTARDEASFREQIALELAIRQFLEAHVTPAVVDAYFEKNRRELDGSRVRVSHIVLRPDIGRGEEGLADCLARAKDIRSRILQGEISFAEAARAHSAGPSRRQDGDCGFIPRRGVAHEEFARQAFELAKGEISQPVTTPAGVHLLQVTDLQPGRLRLARIRPQLEQVLFADLLHQVIADGRRTTAIEYAPGVAYFDPETPADGGAPRRVLAGTGIGE
jgi:peptidyl-prolyl cis-trans isomerase C